MLADADVFRWVAEHRGAVGGGVGGARAVFGAGLLPETLFSSFVVLLFFLLLKLVPCLLIEGSPRILVQGSADMCGYGAAESNAGAARCEREPGGQGR